MLFTLRFVLTAFVASTATVSAVSGHALKPPVADTAISVDNSKRQDMLYIRNLSVHYSDDFSDRPLDALEEFGDLATFHGGDVNWGFGGKYVWLVPEYTTDYQEAATSFRLLRTDKPVPTLSDLAAGAGGDYRYLISETHYKAPRINWALLLRSRDHMELSEGQWVALGPDLNEGRGGSYLYLEYGTVPLG